ncbi:PAS domain S-box protein [Flavobacterium pectinovorum]|uniref:histidine kinase n=1 Tax=Flavobacterium pectinovorum TaxID=29533 RepID=A0A502EVW9_9FLAO|nr:PAS domain S-box protein [Flavobacterium pectinovorum]TPG42048.1 PAS domain S-box protein [Flavobacterium pectinovorum]
MKPTNKEHYFLADGGEMGELLRSKDWSKTPIGNPETWPQSLCTIVAVMLNNPFGMYIAWGNDYTQLYNDAFRPILGATKHPEALGISSQETFAEIWDTIGPMFFEVMKGKAVSIPDFKVILNRNGFDEDCYFEFSYSPIKIENGTIGGVLVTVIETTEKKKATEALQESNSRFINNIMQAPVAMCVFRGKNHVVEIANAQMIQLWGTEYEKVINKPIFEALPEAQNQDLEILLDNVFKTGEKFVANERLVLLPRNGKVETTYINFVYQALRDTDGTISGVVAIAIEVTPQILVRSKVEESEQKIRQLVENAPFPIAVYVGKEMVVELANDSIIKIWGKGNDVIGKSFKDVLPELDNQLVFEQINTVLETGKSFHTKNTPLDLTVDGELYTYYFNYSLTPLYDVNGEVYAVMNTGVDLTDLNLAKKRIEESEQNLQSMVLQSPIGICVLDAKTLVSEIVNESFVEVAGKRYDEIAGKYYWDTFAEVKPYYEEALQKVADEGIPFFVNEVEMMLIRHGKEEKIYVTFVYAPLKNIEGEVKKIAIWVLDNTQQVIARQKIEEADKRFRNTVKQAPVGITILRGSNFVVETANEAYLKLVDREENDFVGKPLFDSLPEVEETVSSMLNSVLKTGIPYHGNEVPIPIKRYGKLSICYFDFLYHPLKEEDGKISGIIVTVTEVSEKVEVRKKIEQNEERLKIIVEASELGTWELNVKTREPLYSKRYLEIIGGYTENVELTHEQLLKHLHPDDMHIRNKAFKEALTSGYLNYEARMIWKDQSIHWMEGKGKLFYDNENNPEKLIGTIRDITDEKNHQQELEESEKRFRNLVMQSPVPKAILKGRDMKIEIANIALLKTIWKKEEDEVQDKNLFEIFPELEQQKYGQLLKKVYKTGEVHSESESLLYINGKDGKHQLYIDFEYAPLRESDNSISGIKMTLIDVTEKVEARKKIQESEKRFRSLTESIPQLIWETDEKGNALFASGKWFEYTGIKPAGEAEWKAMIHPDDYDENARIWSHSLETGEAYRCDVRVRRKDGYYRWHAVIGEPVYNKDNKIIKWVGAFTDIHTEKAFTHELEQQVTVRTKELSQINESLRKSEERYHLMVEEVQDYAILYLNHDGIIENWNVGAEKIKGYKADEIIGKYFSIFYTKEDRESNLPQKLLNLAIEKGKATQEGWRVRKDGTYFWASVVITAIHNKKHQVIGFSKVTHDLTEKKRASDKLKQNALELEQKNTELEQMNKELQSFAYISSHDLQEPLRKIQTFATQIMEKELQNLSDNGKDKFMRMQNAAQRMQTLINDLLSYSRTNIQERVFEKTEIAKIIDEVKDDLKEELEQKDATIEMGKTCKIDVIPFQFRQLLYNLISNSLKFSKPETRTLIKINSEIVKGATLDNDKLNDETNYCHIRITDNGIGFEQQYSSKIFEVFQRLHGKLEYTGTGIGLAIVKKIVDNHNGFITATGEQNIGATFDIYIPVK